jgi:diguanylate cyclase (GGDEF)-like protein/PAS domain S-box-containing protein
VLVLWTFATGPPGPGPGAVAAALVCGVVAVAAVAAPARHAYRQAVLLAGKVEAVASELHPASRDHHWEPGRLRGLVLDGTNGTFGRLVAAVNELIEALEEERTFRSIVDASGALVVVLGPHGVVTFASESVTTVLGWPVDEVQGSTLAGLVHAGDLEEFLTLVDDPDRALRTEDVPRLRLRAHDGTWRVLELSVSVQRAGAPGPTVLTGRDVTDQVAIERELVHQATHDVLTGLPNRKALLQLAEEKVTLASPIDPVSVIMIDLDRFKDVNDSLGHAVGDQLLAQVGPRLRSILRPSDTIARLGGDEFAVLLPGAGEDGAQMVADRLAMQLVDPFVIDGMELHVEASLGIAVSHRIGRDGAGSVETLFREADIAMYRAKEYGMGVATFDPARDSGQNRSRLELSAELRRAISEGQLILHYQPVVDILEGRLVGVEALVRWQHPERGLLLPGDFLPLAEKTGLIMPLSKLVLASATQQAARWAGNGWPVQIAVNISPRWLQHGDLTDTVEQMLAEYGVSPDLIRLEITESAILADPEDTLPLLMRLREMGIGLSLDDFGTGYSSMTHLRQLPVDEVKVDRAFVQAMTSAPEDAVIVRAAIGLGHDLGMAVVAEGIEDVETLAEIVASGCSLAQGYYFSPPLPAQEVTDWAHNRFGTATSPVLPQPPRVPFAL